MVMIFGVETRISSTNSKLPPQSNIRLVWRVVIGLYLEVVKNHHAGLVGSGDQFGYRETMMSCTILRVACHLVPFDLPQDDDQDWVYGHMGGRQLTKVPRHCSHRPRLLLLLVG
jgi:hypothetical protein